MKLSDIHQVELKSAMQILENPGIAAKITNWIGSPIEKGLKLLPNNWNEKIVDITQTALLKSAEAAIFTIKDNPTEVASNRWHKFGVAVTGGVGGLFGLPGLVIELPVSTTIILRSIAEIARAEGESVNNYNTKLACLEVFALGGKGKSDDSTESGYFIVRAALARSITEAAESVAAKSIAEEGAPALLQLIVKIAQRFSIQVSEKAAAQAIPAIGAAGGAIINAIFIDHFQDMAKGHFVIRRLEKIYGKEMIKTEYENLLADETALSIE